MPEVTLSTEIQYLKGVGPRLRTPLNRLHIDTFGDLLFHLPRRYEDRRNLPQIRSVVAGEPATIRGKLITFESRPVSGGRVLLKGVIRDQSGSMILTWFNQPWLARKLESYHGELIAYGNPKLTANGLEITSPEFELCDALMDQSDFARIMPIYPLTEGLGQLTIRRLIKDNLDLGLQLMHEPLPESILARNHLMPVKQALKEIHAPSTEESASIARKRLVFEEFFYLQLALAMRRQENQQEIGISFPIRELLEGNTPELTLPPQKPEVAEKKSKTSASGRKKAVLDATHETNSVPATLFVEEIRKQYSAEPLQEQIHRILPFVLTNAQNRVINDIWEDMQRSIPMNRLVQGDVGSGKTAVAACAMLAAVRCGYQCALMAPTEILAEQHASSLHKFFDPLGIEIGLVTGRQGARERRTVRSKILTSEISIAIGTHALIQEGVDFNHLGFVVVDEQHRFGVLQRAALREKGKSIPDVLVMTATPIPRTLALTVFGDLDISVIDELPPGRKPIKTHWKPLEQREQVYASVRKLIEQGRQAYFVCPMVSESELMLTQAAEELYFRLSTTVYADLKLGLLHGKMKSAEKEAVMDQFRNGQIDILVSTTVIEVGVDVSNANVMVIEDANRFGLAQLHQLRGRVGRGEFQSYCILLADAKTDDAIARLEAMLASTDGFKISEEDFRLRGPGDVAGTQQSGYINFRIGDILRDGLILEQARKQAIEIVEKNPTLSGEQWDLVREKVGERRSMMALATIS